MAKTSILTILIQLAKKGDADRSTIKGLAEIKSNVGLAIGAFTAFAGAATTVVAALGFFSKAAEESARVDAKLMAVLRSTGGVAGMTANSLDGLADSLSRVSGIDDELIKNAEAVMLTFTQVGRQVFPDAMQAAIDMSAVLGGDVQQSVIQLGKALNVTAGDTEAANMGLTAMRRSGVSFTEEQKKLALEMVRTGDIIGYQKLVLAELSREFGGAAQAMNEAGSKSENLKVSVGNLAEAIGARLLPGQRSLNEALADGIDYLTESVEASNRRVEFEEKLAQQMGMTNSEFETRLRYDVRFREEVNQSIKNMEEAERSAQLYAEAYAAIAANAEEAAGAQIDFNAEMDRLKTIMGGDLMQAQEDYNDKIAEYTQQLANAKTQKDKDTINEKIAAETAAYNERAEAIMFNIQQEAILNSQLPDETKLAMITSLAVAYGEYDQATADAIMSTSEWIQRVEDGTLSEEAAVQWMKNATQNMKEQTGAAKANAGALGDFASNTERAGERAADAVPKFEMMEEAQAQLGDSISSEALPAVSSLRLQLGSMPADGRAWNYFFNIHTAGSVPRVPSAGLHDQQITSSPLGGGFASGGWLTGGIDIVGDAPGGRMTPWTEAIIGGRYVLNAETTRELYEAGMLDNALHHAYGGDLGSGGGGTGGGAGGRTPSRPSGSSGVRLSGSTGTRRPRRRTRAGGGVTLSEIAPPPGAAVDVAAATAAEVVEPLASATESATQASLAAQQQQVTEGIQTRNVIQSGNAEMAGLLRETNELLRQGNTTLPRTITAAVEQVKG